MLRIKTCSESPWPGICDDALAAPVVSIVAVTVILPIANEIGMPTRDRSPHGTRPRASK